MDSASYLSHLRRELGAFEACLAGDLSARVEHCGDWTLYDLADHLGGGNLWAATAVTEQRGDYEAPAAPRDRAALAGWFGLFLPLAVAYVNWYVISVEEAATGKFDGYANYRATVHRWL